MADLGPRPKPSPGPIPGRTNATIVLSAPPGIPRVGEVGHIDADIECLAAVVTRLSYGQRGEVYVEVQYFLAKGQMHPIDLSTHPYAPHAYRPGGWHRTSECFR